MDNSALYLDRQLCFSLYACSRAMTKAYQPMLARFGITYPQYLVLIVLWERHDDSLAVSVKSLGDRLRLDSGTLTPLLKRMEVAGLLHRSRDPQDERSVLIGLTDAGIGLRLGVLDFLAQQLMLPSYDKSRVDRLRGELLWLLEALPK